MLINGKEYEIKAKTDFRFADLHGADLSGADLHGADVSGANGIISFGPIGVEKRIGYIVKHDKQNMVKLGCFWGTVTEALEKITNKYGANSTYCKVVIACNEALS